MATRSTRKAAIAGATATDNNTAVMTDEAPARSRRTARPLLRPTEEQIRQRAYQIYLSRYGRPGDPVADWILAEQQLTAELNS